MHNFKSHFQQDFLAYCTRPFGVHLVMVSVGCLFNSFSTILLSLKRQQNLMKIMFSCIHFPVWPYPPPNNEKLFYTGKLYGLTGMHTHAPDMFVFFTLLKALTCRQADHSSGAVWESRWMSWAVRPNEPSGFHGCKDLLNRASALVTTCP